MTHLKRQAIPKSWPINKKGTAYLVRPNAYANTGIPILVLMRDILQIAKTRKEVKKALHDGNVLINGKKAKDEKNSARMLDIITIVPENKNYIIKISKNKKFTAEETKETDKKISKVICKTKLRGNKTQINFMDGINILSEEKINTNDSCVVNFKDKKISKVIPLKEKAKVLLISGKYAGEEGVIEKIDLKEKMLEVKSDSKNINAQIKQVIIIG